MNELADIVKGFDAEAYETIQQFMQSSFRVMSVWQEGDNYFVKVKSLKNQEISLGKGSTFPMTRNQELDLCWYPQLDKLPKSSPMDRKLRRALQQLMGEAVDPAE